MTFGALLPAPKAAGYEVSVLAAYADEAANCDIPPGMVVGAAAAPLAWMAHMPSYVKGWTDLVPKLELGGKPVAFALLFAALPFGILAICMAKSFSVVMFLIVNVLVAHRVLQDGRR